MILTMEGEEIYDIFNSANKLSSDEAVAKFKDNHWLMKAKDGSNTVLFAVMVPRDAMKEYQKRGVDKLGLDFDDITNFTPKKAVETSLEYKDNRLYAEAGNEQAVLPTIALDSVKYPVEQVPNVDAPVVIKGDYGRIVDAANRIEDVTETDHVFVSVRPNNLYIWGRKDARSMKKVIPLDDFENVNFDWSKAEAKTAGDYNPQEEKGTETIMSIELLKTVRQIGDSATMHLGNHNPMKFVFESDEGVKMSWIITPRIPSQDKTNRIPEEIVEDEDK